MSNLGKRLLIIAVSVALLATGNLAFGTRDGTMTTSISSFNPDEIVLNRLWTEGPVQVLNTFMSNGAFFAWAGEASDGGLSFTGRLKRNFGSDRVDGSEVPLDLREYMDAEGLGELKIFVQKSSYRALGPCPHDASLVCTIAVGWNRERTQEADIQMLVTRISETTYLVVDDSILNLGTE